MMNAERKGGMSKTIQKWYKDRGFDYDEFTRQRWDFHRANSHLPLETYRSRLLRKFGQIVCQRTLFYLDLNYWINLRKVMLGQPVPTDYARLYAVLSQEVSRGAIICPLSFWMFQELVKQDDPASRHATAVLIDTLSQGVAFVPHGELVGQEVLHLIRKVSPQYRNITQWPIRECIWTRTVSFVPDRIPTWGDEIPQEDQLLVQKNWEDFHFFVPLAGIIANAPAVPREFTRVGYNVPEINRRKKDVLGQHRSFKSIFLAELMHTIKENEQHVCDVMAYLYFLETGIQKNFAIEQMPERDRLAARNIIWWGFKKNKITDELPSYHIPAALFAASCWDGSRLLSDNDVFDFYHAQVGIPYCDIFLTEVSLKNIACSRHLRLDAIYKTEIISSSRDAARRVEQLANDRATHQFKPILAELFGANEQWAASVPQ
jgi:hypothetical protein